MLYFSNIKQIVQPTMFGKNVIEWACRLSIIQKFSSHNTIINCMDHHHLPQWGLHIIMGTLCKLRWEHFLHPRLNVSQDRPIFTILLRWRGPPPILPHPFISLGIPFPLPQVNNSYQSLFLSFFLLPLYTIVSFPML